MRKSRKTTIAVSKPTRDFIAGTRQLDESMDSALRRLLFSNRMVKK